ncbi:MAG TPA: carboxypeptidase-like regulatory domain-containing protein [Pyrinomonadaceae bacterium]|jgi:hypothetical protein
MRSSHLWTKLRQPVLLSVCVLALLAVFASQARSQTAAVKAVQVSAVVQKSPAQVALVWPQNSNASSTTIYRKLPVDASWGSALASLPGNATGYMDTNVAVGMRYEYQVQQSTNQYGVAYGYITSGIEVPLIESRGRVILIVDNTFAAALNFELSRLELDLVGDGWTVIRHDVARTEQVANIKSLIKADYASDAQNVRAVFLFGHVPVPYSGALAPDGHTGHYGAWPADLYYGDMDGLWTDNLNLTTNVSGPQSNLRGDRKFDQSTIPSAVELQVGRVDLSDMPAFAPKTELELLRQYLDKDHSFRHALTRAQRRALIDDNFGYNGGEAFAASGWRNFASFFGPAGIEEKDWLTTLSSESYLWAYGCGPGNYDSAAGVGNTADFAAQDPQAVFTLLLGSWFGDWNTQNNFLRAPLATNTYGLASAWAGRPHWLLYPMALGETIGYGARLTQNAPSTLYPSTWSGYIHVALMGDPTLRMHIIAPPSGLSAAATPAATGIELNWTAATDEVEGYYIYRAPSPRGPFSRINAEIVKGTRFHEANTPTGTFTYMVRAVKLETSASGTYFNASQGTFATLSTYSLGGRVVDQNGKGVSGALVSLSGAQLAATETGDNGYFSFGNLTAGASYALTASKSGYDFSPSQQSFINLEANRADANFTATVSATPQLLPILLTEEDSAKAIALDSVFRLRDPFPVFNTWNLSLDQRTRIMLFAVNAELRPGEDVSALKVLAEDAEHRIYMLAVEFVGPVQNYEGLTEIVVKLPDELANRGDIWLSLNLRGAVGNKALITIKNF